MLIDVGWGYEEIWLVFLFGVIFKGLLVMGWIVCCGEIVWLCFGFFGKRIILKFGMKERDCFKCVFLCFVREGYCVLFK